MKTNKLKTKYPLGLILIFMLCAAFVLSCAPTYGDDKSNLKSKTTIEVRNVSTSYDTETYQQYTFEHKKHITYMIHIFKTMMFPTFANFLDS